ncbi:N-acetylneuraminate synthase family protein [Nodularia spumigena CS-589/07]|uniref:N-acetylneuraminate synthase family protein n=1 Tax=Nodularia spumigena TaxID=70799 RepID=UPI00232CB025|nr:N-acetylneuraminate synthase family protein [Nodularia spumigena]MDB9340923.1 N-acetylneuraminate synthase family protein [Nodularia spumigena CS-589/07]
MSNFFCDVSRAYLIAEIGVNHNGDVDLAKQMIDAAKKAGADAVKFQTFSADSLVSLETPKVNYQKNTTSPDETHYDMIRRLELDHQAHYELFNYCTEKSIDFLSTPYDVDSAQFLLKLGVKLFKTASADIVDLPLQRYIASTGNPTIVATGMAGLGEIEQVVDLYEEVGNPNLVLLHCVSNYPCSDQSLNLRAMNTLAQAFSLPVGFSDHSEGFLAAVIAVSMGAKVIEKHFTLDKAMSGPDHRASSTPEEFAQLVQNVRRAEVSQ